MNHKPHYFFSLSEDAAIGACAFLSNKQSIISLKNDLKSYIPSQTIKCVPFQTAIDGSRYDANVGEETELVMNIQHHETECSNIELEDVLSELGLEMGDVSISDDTISWPTFINSSVARPKTLIPIKTMKQIHAATAPQNPTKFSELCELMDSTGIYLYSAFTKDEIDDAKSKNKTLSFECRQFPCASGYSEDPATGIAAGALAASLHKRQIMYSNETDGDHVYEILQGTSMGRPSRISVRIDDYKSEETNMPSISISYKGLVVFDSIESTQVDP